jgi:large subunit ribosomal protein L25
MELPTLHVESRESGRTRSKKIRNLGMVPAVCYGHGKDTIPISVNPLELMTILRGPRGLNSLIRLDGAGNPTVLVQDYQKDPVSRQLLHVDFLQVDTTKPIQREVPFDFLGKPEGMKIGGILQVVRRSALVEALPTEIPEKLAVDVAPLQVGQSIHITDIQLPAGIKVLYEQNYTVCSVVIPQEEKAPVEEAAAVAEGEAVEGEAVEGAPAEGEAAAAGEGEPAKAKEKPEKPERDSGKKK